MDALLSVEETARRLGGVSKYTVHTWLSQGRLRRTKVGARTMIRESELARVIEDGGRSPSPHDSAKVECSREELKRQRSQERQAQQPTVERRF